ncbi:hypothetical protein Y1Q_0010989 [Alligator mississippiensis]|uniref:Uncharacterized protein n=1 Tax=Alligator mississippiensis TaxID=8496 RepID=A0A151NLA7_ALLMI|nr:hypothetical protein Y1Q_0010989 [Alligator mississippiensis]
MMLCKRPKGPEEYCMSAMGKGQKGITKADQHLWTYSIIPRDGIELRKGKDLGGKPISPSFLLSVCDGIHHIATSRNQAVTSVPSR